MAQGPLHLDTPLNGRSVAASLRIVVADDDPATCQSHRECLVRLSHQACVAATGRQLVEQCRLLQPDLVITAVQFSDLDGIAAAEEICRDKPTPIILVPDEGDGGAVERAFHNPYVLGCLFKPVKEVDLRAAIAVAMRRFEQIESLRREATTLRQALEDRKLIERAKGMVMRYAGLDEQEAFRRLRKVASDTNRKLVEVAVAIVTAAEVFQQMEQPQESENSNGSPARHARRHGESRLASDGTRPGRKRDLPAAAGGS